MELESQTASSPPSDSPQLGPGFDFSDPRSPLAPFYLRAAPVALIALLGLVFVIYSRVPLWHTDVWGHLAFGRWIVEHGRLPDREPFSPYSDPSSGFLHTYWLAQTGLYLLYHAGQLIAGDSAQRRIEGGIEFLRAGHALLIVLRLALLWVALRRVSGSVTLAFAALGVILAASFGHLGVLRPQVLGEVCFAALLVMLSRPVLSRRALVLIPVLMVVWANGHGSYLAGFGLLGACWFGRVVEAGWHDNRWSIRAAAADRAMRRLLGVGLVSGLAVLLLNPDGVALVGNTLRMSHHPNVMAMDEWQPISWQELSAIPWVFGVTVALLAIAVLVQRRWLTPTQLLLLGLFSAGAVMHRRMMVWWIMVVPWVLAAYLAPLAERLRERWQLQASVPSLRKTIVAVLLVAVCALWSAPGQWLVSREPVPLERAVSPGTPWQRQRCYGRR